MQKEEIIGAIRSVFQFSKNSQFLDENLTSIREDLALIEGYFSLTKDQSIILAVIFSSSCKGQSVGVNFLINHLGLEAIDILMYSKDFEILIKRNIVLCSAPRSRDKQMLLSQNFYINPQVFSSIETGEQILPELSSKKFTSDLELLEATEIDTSTFDWDDESIVDVPFLVSALIEKNAELPIIKKVNEYELPTEDAYLFLVVIWKTLNGSVVCNLTEIVEKYFHRKLNRVQYLQKILKNECRVTKLDLLKLEEENFYHSTSLLLTEKSHRVLESLGIKINIANKTKDKNAINPKDISYRPLFYNEAENRQIALLSKVLDRKNFKRTQKKLLSNNLPQGILILMYGESGTGKTESVYQLGRQNVTEVMRCDLSALKTKWFGESERLVKEVFIRYAEFAKQCKNQPYLLLNECDGIISSRKSVHSSSVASTENSIQAILLQELEVFKGILFATTNMTQNIDQAYLRRFNFKIHFQKPSQEVREQIWRAKKTKSFRWRLPATASATNDRGTDSKRYSKICFK